MKNKKLLLLLPILFILFPFLSAQITLEDIRTVRDELTTTYQDYLGIGITREVDLYPLALARIDLALELYRNSWPGAAAQEEFENVEFIAEAARVQILAARNYALSLDIQEETESILREINHIRQEIVDIEMQLAQQRELTLQASLEQERREADNRLKSLQNDMIKVGNDARGTVVSMSDLLFTTGSSELGVDLKLGLARIAGILLLYPDLEVTVEGHTDNVGDQAFNQQLSETRAGNVMNFLVEMGVNPERLQAVGCGFSKPVADNTTPEGRSLNRRVDLLIKNH